MTDSKGKQPEGFSEIEEALAELKAGRMLIILDDEDRENEGDLVCAAEFITAEQVNFMTRKACGLVCMPMSAERLDALKIPQMVADNTSHRRTAFGVSIGARSGVTTGISAADRARTIQVAADSDTAPEDLSRPGHVFPLRADPGGVLRRAGHTEASVDLCRMAELQPAAAICEIMNDDGTMARTEQLKKFAVEHEIKMITIAALIRYRMQHERLVKPVASPDLPTEHGKWKIHAYHYELEDQTHVALVMGEPDPEKPFLVRVHSQCLTGDVFGSTRCDCGVQLEYAMDAIAKEGTGAVLYLRQEGRGIGLANKLRAYELQDNHSKDTVEANIELGFPPDLRDYGVGAQILYELGARRLKLMTNNMGKYVALEGYGLEIVERVPIELPPHDDNREYLKTKKLKMGHLLKSV